MYKDNKSTWRRAERAKKERAAAKQHLEAKYSNKAVEPTHADASLILTTDRTAAQLLETLAFTDEEQEVFALLVLEPLVKAASSRHMYAYAKFNTDFAQGLTSLLRTVESDVDMENVKRAEVIPYLTGSYVHFCTGLLQLIAAG